MSKFIYTDKHGNTIKYGDILRFETKLYSESEFAPPEPHFKLMLVDNKPMLYVSGMDEYHDVEDWQSSDDKPDTLKHFEVVLKEVK